METQTEIKKKNAATEDVVIEVKDLVKSFDGNDVLKGFSFNLHRGENLVIMGRSGSGKSVLIKCLVGLIKPDSGYVAVKGKNIPGLEQRELDEVRKKIGFLFQSSALYDSMTVKQNLLFPLRNHGELSQDEKEQRVKEVLKNIGLSDTENKMPSELSGGMRKRVGLGRSLMVQPEIIMYDEPTTGLDPITGNEISQLMIDVQKKYNTSSIIITHDRTCARLTANRVIFLSDGVGAASGTFREVAGQQDPYIQSFFNE